jgi:hypothetical protein
MGRCGLDGFRSHLRLTDLKKNATKPLDLPELKDIPPLRRLSSSAFWSSNILGLPQSRFDLTDQHSIRHCKKN